MNQVTVPTEMDVLLLKLVAKQAEAAETINKFQRSMLIRKLWPEAFKCGNCYVGITQYPMQTSRSIRLLLKKKKPVPGRVTLRRPDGAEKVFPTSEVPNELLPENMRSL